MSLDQILSFKNPKTTQKELKNLSYAGIHHIFLEIS